MFGKYTNDYARKAQQYAELQIEGTLLLAYRAFGQLFAKYIKEGNRALDFGCGTGRSTRYLRELGFEAQGVDIDPNMLEMAVKEDPHGKYRLIENEKIPQRDSYYDLVFSTLVLLEIPKLEKMKIVFEDVYRTMRFNGVFIVLTVNDDFYEHEWVSINTNYQENKKLLSGDVAKVKIKEINLELNDFYWKKEDYRKIANEAGFSIVEELCPKANTNDKNIAWISEKDYSPYVIFVMKKTVSLISILRKIEMLELQYISGKGYFKEIERPSEIIKSSDIQSDGDQSQFSKIILLMQPYHKWEFHKSNSIKKIEHLEGVDLVLHLIYENGIYEKKIIGKENDKAINEFTIFPGTWIAEELNDNLSFVIVSITMIPMSHPADLVEASNEFLNQLVIDKNNFPVIERLTKKISTSILEVDSGLRV